jgi:phospholipid/cholesterol/gamma-HCH transport system substrate-binding protein
MIGFGRRKPPRRAAGVRPPGRLSQAISHATRRLEGHTLALGFAVAAVGAVLGYIAWSSVNGVPFQDRYTLRAMIPEGSPIVAKGDAVRIAGQLAGLVTEVDPEDGATEVEMELRPQFAPVGRDAEAIVRVKSIVYLTYVEIRPGDTDDPMPEGDAIPVAQSGSNVDLLEVVELFDRKARETLQASIYNAGIGLSGRGVALNTSFHDLEAVTEEGTSQLQAIVRDPEAIGEALRGAGATFRGLTGARPDDVGALVASGSETLVTVARRSAELGEAIELLRPVNDELLATAPLIDPLLEDAGELSATLTPVLDELERGLPELNAALAAGDELRAETVRITAAIRPVIRAAAPVIAALEPTVASIDPLLEPLRRISAVVPDYAKDVGRGARGLISATSTRFPQGQTAPGNPALRFAPVFTPHTCREPYPEPGESRELSC